MRRLFILAALMAAPLVSVSDTLFAQQQPFVRGDVSPNGQLDIADPLAMLEILFLGAPNPCPAAGDSNKDGGFDISDPIQLLQFLFLGGAPPPPPYPGCGFDDDPTSPLGCDEHFPCFDIGVEPPRHPSFGIDESDRAGQVLLHNGQLVHSETDLDIRGRLMRFELTRTYRTGVAGSDHLAPGWDANVFRRLEISTTFVRRHLGNGRFDEYENIGAGFVSPEGIYAELLQTLDGYIEREPDGTLYIYDELGRLVVVQDPSGNEHDYEYDANGNLATVEDEFGRTTQFTFDALDRLVSVTDFDGRVFALVYCPMSGLLVEAHSPIIVGTPTGNDFPNGRRTEYEYDPNGNMTSITYPNEVDSGLSEPRLEVAYDANVRVVSAAIGGTNASGSSAGGTLTYEYLPPPPGSPPGTAGMTRVTDRNGNVTEYCLDAAGHSLLITEEPGTASPFSHLYEHNADGELVRCVFPEGNELIRVFDESNPQRAAQGNLIEETRLPDATRGGAQSQITRTWTYEPVFQRPLTETDARGNDAGYVPQNGGAQSAARYTTTYVYDYQENIVPPTAAIDFGIVVPPALLGLGDLNGDGSTSQESGQPILKIDLIVNLLPGSNQGALEGDLLQESETRYRYNQFGQLIELEDPRGNLDVFDYYAEEDPDGDGNDLIPGRDPLTGGYLEKSTRDAFVGPNRLDPPPALAIATCYGYDARGNRISFTDGRGNVTLYTFNELDELVRVEKPKVDPSQSHGFYTDYLYDANGNVIEQRVENWRDDDNGVPQLVVVHPFFVTSTEYDILDNPVRLTDDATRDPNAPPSSQPESLVTEFDYDANENQVTVRTPLATSGDDADNIVTRIFDARDLVFSVTRGTGAEASTITFGYDDNRNVVATTDAEDNDGVAGGEQRLQVYDGFDRLVTVVDRAGNQSAYEYDPVGNVVSETREGNYAPGVATTAPLSVRHFLFDEKDRLFRIDDQLFIPGGVVPTSPVILVDGPASPGDGFVTTRFEYDANDRLTFRVEDDDAVYRCEYDGADRCVRRELPISDPGGAPTERAFHFDANENVVRVEETETQPNGLVPPTVFVTYSVFDALDRLRRRSDNAGSTTYRDYDSRGNVTAKYDARGPVIPDPLAVVPGLINDRGNGRLRYYDGLGRLLLRELELHVNGEGDQPLDTSNPAIPDGLVRNATEWDANGRVVARFDGNGAPTLYGYDSLGRLTSETHADGGVRTHGYDRDHNRTQTTDENGTVHTRLFDGLDRVIRHDVNPTVTQIPGTGLPLIVGTVVQTFEYDGHSRVIRSVDENEPADPNDDWTVETIFDSLSRRIEQVQNGRAVACGYDADDRVELHYPNGRVVGYGYDAHDQPTFVGDAAFAVETAYLGTTRAPIQRLSFVNPNPQPALAIDRQLDAVRRVSSAQSQTFSAGLVSDETVIRDRNHQVREQLIAYISAGIVLDRQHTRQISSIGRIDGSTHDIVPSAGPPPTVINRDIEYGGAQEVLSVFDAGVPVLQNAYSPTYAIINPPFEYDAGVVGCGLRSRDQDFVYQWDGFDRLQVVRLAANPAIVISEYDYDASPCVRGRRVESDVQNSGALDGVTRFYYDGTHVVEETTVVGPSEQTTQQFIFGWRGKDDVVATDIDTNADGNPDALFFFAEDANRNVTLLVDQNGQPVEFYAYDSFLQPMIFDPVFNPIAPQNVTGTYFYGGQRWDPETGLYYYVDSGWYFDCEQGKFIHRSLEGLWDFGVRGGLGNGFIPDNDWGTSEGWFADDDADDDEIKAYELPTYGWPTHWLLPRDDTKPGSGPGASCEGEDNDCYPIVPGSPPEDLTPPTLIIPDGDNGWVTPPDDGDGGGDFEEEQHYDPFSFPDTRGWPAQWLMRRDDAESDDPGCGNGDDGKQGEQELKIYVPPYEDLGGGLYGPDYGYPSCVNPGNWR